MGHGVVKGYSCEKRRHEASGGGPADVSCVCGHGFGGQWWMWASIVWGMPSGLCFTW